MANLRMSGKGEFHDVVQRMENGLRDRIMSFTKEPAFSETINGAKVYFCVYEKYYLRSENRASLSVMVYEQGDDIEIRAIGAAAGSGAIFKFSWGAEDDFISVLTDVMRDLGFR